MNEYKEDQIYLCETDKDKFGGIVIERVFSDKLKTDYTGWIRVKDFEEKYKPEYYGYYVTKRVGWKRKKVSEIVRV